MSSDTPHVVCLHDFGLSTTGHRPDLAENSRSGPCVPVIFGSPVSVVVLTAVLPTAIAQRFFAPDAAAETDAAGHATETERTLDR
jgi:hypothetical protein